MEIGEFEIWILPHNLRAASEKAAELLKSIRFDTLYLHIPRELNHLIGDLALGAPYEQFIEEVKKLNILRESIDSWEYRTKPILLAIRGLKLRRPSLKIICYRSITLENFSTRNSEDIAMLTLRASITGKVDVKEWLDKLRDIVSGISDLADEEGNYILRSWLENGACRRAVCIVDYAAKRLLEKMRANGIRAHLRYIFTPYYFTPPELLLREVARAFERGINFDYRRLEKLINMHVDFIREYVLTSGSYDEAYFRWLRDRCFKGAINSIASSSHTS